MTSTVATDAGQGSFLRVPEPKHGWRSHRCVLPTVDYPLGTIWRCPCGRRWKLSSTRRETAMGDVSDLRGHRLAWGRRRLPWPRHAVAESLTRALEEPWASL